MRALDTYELLTTLYKKGYEEEVGCNEDNEIIPK